MPTQLELLLNKSPDSTPEEYEEWRANDYFSKGDFDPLFLFVVIPTVIQVAMFGLMLGVFVINGSLF